MNISSFGILQFFFFFLGILQLGGANPCFSRTPPPQSVETTSETFLGKFFIFPSQPKSKAYEDQSLTPLKTSSFKIYSLLKKFNFQHTYYSYSTLPCPAHNFQVSNYFVFRDSHCCVFGPLIPQKGEEEIEEWREQHCGKVQLWVEYCSGLSQLHTCS